MNASTTPVVLITGAGGQLGSAIARAVAVRGGHPVLSDVAQDALSASLRALTADGLRATFAAADVRDDASVMALVNGIVEEHGRIDACVNNAGIEGPIAPLEELNVEAVEQLYQVNVFGILRVLRAVLPHMRRAGTGRIVNMASGAGLAGTPLMSAYSSSKHAVVGITRSLAGEVAGVGIAVNAVCPGCVDSPMMSRIEDELARRSGRDVSFVPSIPAGRYARPDEVANLVAYLALEAPIYMTGDALVLDGALRA